MKNTVPKISVIVPVYNAGELLVKCIDTLVRQTLTDIEIILVLDAPTDGSDKIAKFYSSRDDRIVLVENNSNLHIGNSRNRGIEVARGEYVGFSDHDDFRSLDMYEKLYLFAKQNDADIVFSQSVDAKKTAVDPYEYTVFDLPSRQKYREYCLSDLIGNGNNERAESLFVNIHGCIYRRSLLFGNEIKFVDTKIITPEDRLFQIETFLCSNKVFVYDKTAFYHHIYHENNESEKETYKDPSRRAQGMNYLYLLLKRKNLFDVYSKEFYLYVEKQFILLLSKTLYPIPRFFAFLKTRRILRSYPFTKEAFRKNNLNYNKKGFKRLFRYFLIYSLR